MSRGTPSSFAVKWVRRASRPVHRDDLFVDDLALREADHQVTSQGGQRDVEARVAVGVGVHDRALALVVPGEVVLMVDGDRCPVRSGRADSIGRLLAPIDVALKRRQSWHNPSSKGSRRARFPAAASLGQTLAGRGFLSIWTIPPPSGPPLIPSARL